MSRTPIVFTSALLMGVIAGWAFWGRDRPRTPRSETAPRGASVELRPAARARDELVPAPREPAEAERPRSMGAAAHPASTHDPALRPYFADGSLEVEFLPLPNGGRPVFEQKYAGFGWAELEVMAQKLRDSLNAEFDPLMEHKFALGQFEEEIVVGGAGSVDSRKKEPQGLGRVQPAIKSIPMGDRILVQTTWITEAEHPDYFQRAAEFEYVAGLSGHLRNLASSGEKRR